MPGSAAALPATAFWDAGAPRGRRLSELHAPPAHFASSASSGSGSSSSGGSLLRHYIDPWDLENYAYLRRQDASAGCCSSTPALESSQSDFSYVPGSLEYPCAPAAVDEEPFYNAARTLRKTSTVMRRHSAAAGPAARQVNGGGGHAWSVGHMCHNGNGAWKNSHAGHTDGESGGEGSAGSDSCRLYSPSLLVRRPPGDLVYVYGGRKLALPDVMGHDACCYSLSGGGGSSSEDEEERCCYFDSRTLTLPPPPASPEPPPPPTHVPRYALSRHGHLRLDYSWSWASLDRYIAAAD